MNTVFIHTNNKQLLGAQIARYALEKHRKDPQSFTVEILNVDSIPAFSRFAGKTYLRGGEERVFDPHDLQSFTLSRFMPPEKMNYRGKAMVIDPDIFALSDVSELFTLPMDNKKVALCRKKDAWDTSVMVMNCSQLTSWNMERFLNTLQQKELDYNDLMTLRTEHEEAILELPRIWNNLDTLTPETKMIHMTGRITQPWKTGLPIDFTRNKMPKLFGLIPREPFYALIGKHKTRYERHPNRDIETLFFSLAREALQKNYISENDVELEIAAGHIRPDFMTALRIL